MTHIRAKDWTYGDATIIDLIRWQMRLTASGGSGFRPTRIDAQNSLPTDSGELRHDASGYRDPGNHGPCQSSRFCIRRVRLRLWLGLILRAADSLC